MAVQQRLPRQRGIGRHNSQRRTGHTSRDHRSDWIDGCDGRCRPHWTHRRDRRGQARRARRARRERPAGDRPDRPDRGTRRYGRDWRYRRFWDQRVHHIECWHHGRGCRSHTPSRLQHVDGRRANHLCGADRQHRRNGRVLHRHSAHRHHGRVAHELREQPGNRRNNPQRYAGVTRRPGGTYGRNGNYRSYRLPRIYGGCGCDGRNRCGWCDGSHRSNWRDRRNRRLRARLLHHHERRVHDARIRRFGTSGARAVGVGGDRARSLRRPRGHGGRHPSAATSQSSRRPDNWGVAIRQRLPRQRGSRRSQSSRRRPCHRPASSAPPVPLELPARPAGSARPARPARPARRARREPRELPARRARPARAGQRIHDDLCGLHRMPAATGGTVQVGVAQASWIAPGQIVYVGPGGTAGGTIAGYLMAVSTTGLTGVWLQNNGVLGNAAAGVTIVASAR